MLSHTLLNTCIYHITFVAENLFYNIFINQFILHKCHALSHSVTGPYTLEASFNLYTLVKSLQWGTHDRGYLPSNKDL